MTCYTAGRQEGDMLQVCRYTYMLQHSSYTCYMHGICMLLHVFMLLQLKPGFHQVTIPLSPSPEVNRRRLHQVHQAEQLLLLPETTTETQTETRFLAGRQQAVQAAGRQCSRQQAVQAVQVAVQAGRQCMQAALSGVKFGVGVGGRGKPRSGF